MIAVVFEVRYHDFDVMFFVTVELGEGGDGIDLTVGAHQLVALALDPFCNGFVVPFAASDQRGAQIEVFGFFGRRTAQHLGQKLPQLGGTQRPHGVVRIGMVLDTDSRVEEPQVLSDFRNGCHGGFAGPAGDPLFNCHGGWDAAKVVDVGPRKLFHKLAGVSRHGLHESALAFGEDDVEGEGGLAGTRHPGDHDQFLGREREADVLQVVFAGADNGETLGFAHHFGFHIFLRSIS